MTPEERRTQLKRLLRQRPSPQGTQQPLLRTGPLWAASPRRVLSHGEAARRAAGRRADGHVAGATTTTAGVRRRPGAAEPVPAPRPGFPATCGLGLRAHDGRAEFARTAECPKTPALSPLRELTRMRLRLWRRERERAGSASWDLCLLLASPLDPSACLKRSSGAETRPAGSLVTVQSWKHAGAKKAQAEGSHLLSVDSWRCLFSFHS